MHAKAIPPIFSQTLSQTHYHNGWIPIYSTYFYRIWYMQINGCYAYEKTLYADAVTEGVQKYHVAHLLFICACCVYDVFQSMSHGLCVYGTESYKNATGSHKMPAGRRFRYPVLEPHGSDGLHASWSNIAQYRWHTGVTCHKRILIPRSKLSVWLHIRNDYPIKLQLCICH